MTRKHFKALADIVAEMHKEELLPVRTHRWLVAELGDLCHRENNRFDFNLFNRACGLELDGVGLWQPVENKNGDAHSD